MPEAPRVGCAMDGMATDVYCLEGGLRVKIEQENRRRRWTRLTVRDVPNAGDAKDGIIAGLQ